MIRECLHCQQIFSSTDLARSVSKGIEAERKSCGVQGMAFRCYACSHCGHENLFVDLHPLAGETAEEFQRRRDDVEASIRQTTQPGVHIAVVAKRPMP